MKQFWSLEKTGYLVAAALLATTAFGCGGGDARAKCGDDEMYQDGACVEVESLCGPNTTYEDGQCVAEEPVECGLNAQLDPNTNECVATEEVCGGQTAYDSETDSCVPTSEVCQDGTVFDAEAGLCVATVACVPGDVIVEGFCLSPAEALAAEADVNAKGTFSNPFEGGTPHAMTVGDIGESTVFIGSIGAPVDEVQQFDFFSFSAEAGEWYEISVQSLGLPSPHFDVWLSYDGDTHWYRSASLFTGSSKARQIAVPRDAEVIVQVGPEGAFLDIPAIGGEGWDYVGSVKQVEPATPEIYTLGDGDSVAGELGRLDENFFVIDEFEPGTHLAFSWQDPALHGVVQVWDSETGFVAEHADDEFYVTVPDSGEFQLLMDWFILEGMYENGYELNVREVYILAPGESMSSTVTASADGDVFEIRQTNLNDAELLLRVTSVDSGETLLEQELDVADATNLGAVARVLGLYEGSYTVSLENLGGSDVNTVDLDVLVISPTVVTDLSAAQTGEAWSGTHSVHSYYLVESSVVSALEVTATRTSGTSSTRMYVYGMGNQHIYRTNLTIAATARSTTFAMGANEKYVIRLGGEFLFSTTALDYELTFDEFDSLATEDFTLSSTANSAFITQTNDAAAEAFVVISDSDGNLMTSQWVDDDAEFVQRGFDQGTYSAHLLTPSDAANTGALSIAMGDFQSFSSYPSEVISATVSNHGTATDTITVSGCNTINSIDMDINIGQSPDSTLRVQQQHITVELTAPDGTTHVLWNEGGGTTDYMDGNLNYTLVDAGAELISEFEGLSGNGDWEISLNFRRHATFNGWTLNLNCD